MERTFKKADKNVSISLITQNLSGQGCSLLQHRKFKLPTLKLRLSNLFLQYNLKIKLTTPNKHRSLLRPHSVARPRFKIHN